jgi:hypothetical protein
MSDADELPPSVSRALQAGGEFVTHAGRVSVSHVSAGTLVLPTGRLVTADPGYLDEAQPLEGFKVPAGEYPVTLAMLRYPDKDQRITAAILHLGGPAAKPPIPRSWRQLGTFGVDTGLACYLDAAALDTARQWTKKGRELFWSGLNKSFDASYQDTRSYGSTVIDPRSGANLVAFSSGWGDGGYASFLALDGKGKPLFLLTDFGLLMTQEEVDGLDEEL